MLGFFFAEAKENAQTSAIHSTYNGWRTTVCCETKQFAERQNKVLAA